MIGHHLVIQHSHGKSPFIIGKPSISMSHLYHGYVSHNQRVYQLVTKQLVIFNNLDNSLVIINGLPIKNAWIFPWRTVTHNQMVDR